MPAPGGKAQGRSQIRVFVVLQPPEPVLQGGDLLLQLPHPLPQGEAQPAQDGEHQAQKRRKRRGKSVEKRGERSQEDNKQDDTQPS